MFNLGYVLFADHHDRYGEDWKTYKKLVPYRIIPYIY